jgi:hypothetical protein
MKSNLSQYIMWYVNGAMNLYLKENELSQLELAQQLNMLSVEIRMLGSAMEESYKQQFGRTINTSYDGD